MVAASTAYAFLSYSRRDEAFAARLAHDLRNQGIRLWFDQLDIPPGRNWDEAVQRALEGAGAVLFLVSESSIASPNVLDEITFALDARKWIIPLMIADVQVPLRAARLQRVSFAPNYGAGLARLVAHLRGDASRTSELQAIAGPVPADAAGANAGQRRHSLDPTQRAIPAPSKSPSWLLPAILGAGLATSAIVASLIILIWPAITEQSTRGPAGELDAPGEHRVAADVKATTPELLHGTWTTPCATSFHGEPMRVAITITAGTFQGVTTYYGAPDCVDPRYDVRLTADVLGLVPHGPSIYAIDYRITALQYSEEGVARNMDLALSSQAFGVALQPGAVVYDLMSVQNGVLYEGRNLAGHVALSAAERPRVLEDSVPYIRETASPPAAP